MGNVQYHMTAVSVKRST